MLDGRTHEEDVYIYISYTCKFSALFLISDITKPYLQKYGMRCHGIDQGENKFLKMPYGDDVPYSHDFTQKEKQGIDDNV